MSSFSSAELDEQKVKAAEPANEGLEATRQDEEEEGNLAVRRKALDSSKQLQLQRQKAAKNLGITSNKTMQNLLAPQDAGPTQETEKKGRKSRKGDKE